jgi:hypothetical protein
MTTAASPTLTKVKNSRVGEGQYDCRLSPHQTGRADFPHPAYPKIFVSGMHEVNRLGNQRNHRLGEALGIRRLVGASSMYNDSPLTTIQFRQGPFARPALPGVLTTTNPSDSRSWPQHGYWFPWPVVSAVRTLVTPRRVSQVPVWVCRCPPSALTPGSPIAAFAHCLAVDDRLHPIWRVGRSRLRNEAETGSLSLRLTSSSSEASSARVAPRPAQSTTWRTSTYHDSYLSTN